jgi:membrane protein DedA with SNARE-associated domain
MLPVATFIEVNTVKGWLDAGGYAVLFGLLFSCGLGVPIPEDVPLIAAGILIYHHNGTWRLPRPWRGWGSLAGTAFSTPWDISMARKSSRFPSSANM